jgi:hypothetical protein
LRTFATLVFVLRLRQQECFTPIEKKHLFLTHESDIPVLL